MVYDPRVRTEHLDAYNAGRFDDISPEIFQEVKELAERIKKAQPQSNPFVAAPVFEPHEEHEE